MQAKNRIEVRFVNFDPIFLAEKLEKMILRYRKMTNPQN